MAGHCEADHSIRRGGQLAVNKRRGRRGGKGKGKSGASDDKSGKV